MTPKLAGKLEYNAQTLAALAKWMERSAPPKRWPAKKKPVPKPKRLL